MSTVDDELALEEARRGTDPIGADFTEQRGHKPWPDPKKMKFNLDRDALDPHNPSNRCAPLHRRHTDK